MHADSLLIHPNFSSELMITHENLLFIRFKTDQKLTFDPVRTNEGGSRKNFRTVWVRTNCVTWSLILKRNSGASIVNRHAYASRDYLLHILYWIKMWTSAYLPWLYVRPHFVSLTIREARNQDIQSILNLFDALHTFHCDTCSFPNHLFLPYPNHIHFSV